MEKVQSTYLIDEHTLALLPARNTEYNTIVLARDQNRFIRMTPLEIIKATCLEHFSSYSGRREAVIYQTGYKRKVPIPINPSKDIFTFPTLSPDEFECIWLFHHHIHKIKPIQSPTANKLKYQSIIYFKNGVELPINISHHVLEKQMYRTMMCVHRIREITEKPNMYIV